MRDRIRARNRHRIWWIRAPLLVWFVLTLRAGYANAHPDSIWRGINLAIHGIGHVVFLPFPDFLTVLGGTLFEIVIPIVVGVLFYRKCEDFGVATSIFWLGTVLTGVALYAGDARAQLLPLVSPFPGPVTHDWSHLLAQLGILHHDHTVFQVFRTAGLLAMSFGIVSGTWVLGLMATDPELRAAVGATRSRTRFPRRAESLAREDAAFRVWWAMHGEELSSAEEPTTPPPEQSRREVDPPESSPPDVADAALDWLDRRAEEGAELSPEEVRFRRWLKEQER